jgi:hypothetical protein
MKKEFEEKQLGKHSRNGRKGIDSAHKKEIQLTGVIMRDLA